MTDGRTRGDAEALFLDNPGLVFYFFRQYAGAIGPLRLPNEDVLQELQEAIWRAALTYSPERGAFTTWAGLAAKHQILKLARSACARKRCAAARSVSLDAPLPNAENGLTYGDLLAADDDVEAACCAAIDLERHKKSLSPRAQRALELRLRGYCQTEIAAQLGCSQAQVHRYLKRAAAFTDARG